MLILSSALAHLQAALITKTGCWVNSLSPKGGIAPLEPWETCPLETLSFTCHR